MGAAFSRFLPIAVLICEGVMITERTKVFLKIHEIVFTKTDNWIYSIPCNDTVQIV